MADGQCMIIVEQGKVVEVCAEPGEFTYDTSSEPSIFSGNLSEGILNTFDTMKNVLHMVEIQEKIREFTILIPRS